MDWLYEPRTFYFDYYSERRYTPDFWVCILGEECYIEVKGRMRPKDRANINGFRREIGHRLMVVDGKYFTIKRRKDEPSVTIFKEHEFFEAFYGGEDG